MEITAETHGIISGLPFLSSNFDAVRFLTAVACVRRHRQKQVRSKLTADLNAFLQPRLAREIYGGKLSTIPNRELTFVENGLVARARYGILKVRAESRELLEVPLDIRAMLDVDSFGSSSAAKPQHIFLGRKSFSSDEELREQLLHEVAHVWLYMVQELWPLHPAADAR